MSKKAISHAWMKVQYAVCVVNSVLLLLFAVDYLLCEIDLFLVVWFLSSVLLVTIPLGLIAFIFSLFHLLQRPGRIVAIWSAALVLAAVVVFVLLPPGSSRVPYKMEKHYLKNQATMESLANRLYSIMPDSTQWVLTSSGEMSWHRITSETNYFGYPMVEDSLTLPDSASMVVTTQALPEDIDYKLELPQPLQDSILDVLKSLHCEKLTLYKPTALALFDYIHSGFASYWFEMTLIPFTSEQMQQQMGTYNAIPFSPQVCFRFHGGATDGDGPFPYKEAYLKDRRAEQDNK